MKLSINLATRRYINLRQLDLGLLIAFLVLGALAAWCALDLVRNASEISRVKALIQGLANKGHGAPVTASQISAQAGHVAFANQVIERKSVNWINLLNRLEDVVPAGVAITEVAPDRQNVLRLAGVARGFGEVRTLMENMERSKSFTDVYLLGQNEAKVGQTQRGMTFNISCKVDLQ